MDLDLNLPIPLSLSMPLAFGFFALLTAWVSVTHQRLRRRRAKRAPSADLRYLIHALNDDRCTGCETCIDACPTNVLALVSHKSRVVQFADCVQCEKCARVCPTQALAMHLIGDEPPAIKVPDIDRHFQTKVPGQYLIGEVAGKPLVKNAANLGRMAVEHIAQSGLVAKPRPTETDVDVVIVGSGPGGLSAALTCERRGLSYVVLEKERMMAATVLRYPAGKPFMAEPHDCRNVSLLPVFDTSKETLVDTWKQLVSQLGVRVQLDEAVDSVERGSDGFTVTTRKATYTGQRVVLAIGVRGKPRTLKVPGEERRKVHMLLEDPADHRGQRVLVVGGGDSALEAAVALCGVDAEVTLSYRKKGFNRAKAKNRSEVEALVAAGKLTVLFGSNVTAIGATDVTLKLADGASKTITNDASFILIGADPPAKWLRKHGVELIERPHSYSVGSTDALVLELVADAADCPRTASEAAAVVRGRRLPVVDERLPIADPVSGSVTRVLQARKPRRATTLGDLARRLRDAVTPRRRRSGADSSVETFVAPLPRRAETVPGFADEPTLVDFIPPGATPHFIAEDRSSRHEW